MTRDVPIDFQQRIDSFNAAQGGPAKIEVCWDIRRDCWVVYAVPVYDSTYPGARNKLTRMLLKPFADDSGREGVFLFYWPHAFLDERLFKTLVWADSFRDKQHFDKTVEAPEAKREADRNARVKDAFAAARSYWRAIDNLTMPVGPDVRSNGDWRTPRIR